MHRSPPRIEDQRLLTGRGRFAADWNLPGQLHACFVRSERAHAELVALDPGAALAMPGVSGVLTGDDVAAAGFRSLPSSLPFTGIGGQELCQPARPALAREIVRFVGEPIACVVAASSDIAQDAAEAVEVQYRDRVPVIAVEAARASGAPQLHAEVPGNICFAYETGDAETTAQAFARAHRVVGLRLDHQRLVANPMEPRACLITFDAACGDYTLYTSTQGVNALRTQLAAVTGLSEERFRIVARDVGGGFGVRYNAYPEHCVLLLAAQRFKAPVKWIARRTESFLSDEQGRGIVSEGEIALDREQRFLGFRFRFICDMGAYLTPTGPFINIKNVLDTLSGVYSVPTLSARFELVMTNTVPVGAYRGAGRPLAAYMVERLVDQAAVECGIDRVQLRRHNFVPRHAFPYRTPHAGTIDCGDFESILDKALQSARYGEFVQRRDASWRAGKLRGIGLATYIEFSSPGFYPQDEVAITFECNGIVTLHAVTHSSGQGHETTFAQIVAGVLRLPLERMRLSTGDADLKLLGSATGGSRSLFGVGSVFRLAAEGVLEKGRTLAAREFGVDRSMVDFQQGEFRARDGSQTVTLAALIARAGDSQSHPLDIRMAAKFGGNYPNGCHVAEVEIDPETGACVILTYTAVDDCGIVINPAVVEGQIIGGVVQGVGQALCEHALYDPDNGQLLSGSFADYTMPRAGSIRAFTVLEYPVPTKENPLGAKGVGEAGATGAPPAIMNAVLDALRSAGVTKLDSPATPARVWEALRKAAKTSKQRTPRSHQPRALAGRH